MARIQRSPNLGPPRPQPFGRERRIGSAVRNVVAPSHERVDGTHRLAFRPRHDDERVVEILPRAPYDLGGQPIGFFERSAHFAACFSVPIGSPRNGSMWIVTSLTRGS